MPFVEAAQSCILQHELQPRFADRLHIATRV